MTLQKIKEKKAHIGIIGLGYVGLPLAIEFCKTGFQVTGLDIDQEKIDLLSRGKSYINHISGANIKHLNQECKFKGTTNFTLISNLDCILICVPTPLSKNREPDMSYIIATAQKISPHLVKNQLIVLE
ncbi:MAG: nucleotide sugar dehydrogenase, partial [Nitrospina sp.]|nr:nucleotide sugar dehydrogenase [Nitrospina sp.]